MNSIFNHNLIYLAIFDNIYVLCAILECIRKYFLATQIQTVYWIHYYNLHIMFLKSPKLFHLSFSILVFSTSVCPIKTYLSGNTV